MKSARPAEPVVCQQRNKTPITKALKLALVVLSALFVACGGEEQPLNVLVIAIDTLRADHLGCYGYERATSPAIDRLASSGILFERAISQAPWTLPSFASIFTSLYPTQHGADAVDSRMRPWFPTLASILKRQGYATAALVNAPLLQPAYGLDMGFDLYDSAPPDSIRKADHITSDALAWLEGSHGRPFLLFVHYFDPHLPYAPPAPFDRKFGEEYAGPIKEAFDLAYFESRQPAQIRGEIETLNPADRDRIVALYDGEIAFTDSAVGVLLDGLRDNGLDRRTLIVLLSDHGEEFFDHGGLDHGHTLFDELLHVPLILSLPGTLTGGRRLGGEVRMIDVAPTILDILGLPIPEHFEGESLLPEIGKPGKTSGAQMPRRAETSSRRVYAEALRRNQTLKCVYSYPYKLILDTRTREKHLYNLERDPGELHEVGASEPTESHRLEQAVYRTVFGMSDTWYIEMVAGERTHTFDLSIAVGGDRAMGAIEMYRLLDSDGDGSAEGPESAIESTPRTLRIDDLHSDDRPTLAFTAGPRKAPVEFDLAIDGRGAAARTYLGRQMLKPEAMPFSRAADRRSVRSSERPAGQAEPPYFLIWHSRARFGGRLPADLDKGTVEALRALGYIQ